MNLIIARTSGFCDGVKRAMHMAVAAADQHGALVSDGPLVHNHQALELLSLRGVSERDPGGDAPVLIRAHGVEPERRRAWRASGRAVVDATCPRVAGNQRLARRMAEAGHTVVLAGDREHAEVRAVAAAAGPDCLIASSVEDIRDLAPPLPPFLMAQTTFNVRLFTDMSAELFRRFPDARVVDSICRATHDRQEEAERLARRADVLVVVGGRHSANTLRLAETARKAGKPAILVETAAELDARDFSRFATAAVTSGASTPGWVLQEVIDRLRTLGRPTAQSRVFALFKFLGDTRLGTLLAAAGTALAAQCFATDRLYPALALAGACCIFFTHTLNRRVPPNPEARRLSAVDSFYRARGSVIRTLAGAAAVFSLALAATGGWLVLAIHALTLTAAALYAGAAARTAAGRRRFRGPLPPSWTTAATWTFVLAGPPALLAPSPWPALAAATYLFFLRLGCSLIRDVHDTASDSLIGIDTMPARIGAPKAVLLAQRSLCLAATLPLTVSSLRALAGDGLSGILAFRLALAAAPALGIYLLERVRTGNINDNVLIRFGIDAMGMAIGLAALLFAPGSGPW